MLTRLGADREGIVRETELVAMAGPSGGVIATAGLRRDPARGVMSASATRAVDAAYGEVEAVGAREIGSDFLVVGLLLEGRGVAARVMEQAGVTLDSARAHLDTGITAPRADTRPILSRRGRVPRRTRAVESSSPEADPSVSSTGDAPGRAHAGSPDSALPRSKFRMEIDDRSELSIYEQIIARVQEAIATGILEPGERLPPVRQLADQLDIAPGTVARAYSALEARGVLITEGARGTRVAKQGRPGLSSDARRATLVELLRPVAVEAFHLGATAADLHAAVDVAAQDIRPDRGTV
jgi:GntR family transcriptional regulator